MKIPNYFQKISDGGLTIKKAAYFGTWLIAILFVFSALAPIVVYFWYTTNSEVPETNIESIKFSEPEFVSLSKLMQQRKDIFESSAKVAIPNAFR